MGLRILDQKNFDEMVLAISAIANKNWVLVQNKILIVLMNQPFVSFVATFATSYVYAAAEKFSAVNLKRARPGEHLILITNLIVLTLNLF